MQLFMKNVAFAANEFDILLALADVLHRPPFSTEPPINFDVQLFWKPKRHSHKGSGLLTLPTDDVGLTFLLLYGAAGIHVQGRVIRFNQRDRKPDLNLIQKVRTTPWEDPKVLQEENRKIAKASEAIILRACSFGRLCRDRSFSAEVDRLGDLRVVTDIAAREVRIEVPSLPISHFQPLASLLQTTLVVAYTASHITAVSTTSGSNGEHHVFLMAHSPPVFTATTNNLADAFASVFGDHKEPPVLRYPSLGRGKTMPPVSRCACIAFQSRQDLKVFIERCKMLRLPRPVELDTPVVRRGLYSNANLDQLQNLLKTLDFGLAYEVEKSVSTTILDPEEILRSLRAAILRLQRDSALDAAPIFRHFVNDLSVPTFASTGRRRRTSRPDDQQPPEVPLAQLLDESAAKYRSHAGLPRSLFQSAPAIYQSYQVTITPSSMKLEGPLPDRGNGE
jgi:RNA-dependent RNA polymerase